MCDFFFAVNKEWQGLSQWSEIYFIIMYSTLIVRKKNLYLHTHLLYGHVSCQFLYLLLQPHIILQIYILKTKVQMSKEDLTSITNWKHYF